MKKKDKNKELILEQLKKIPIVETVCQKTGVSRASYYRWRIEDPEFAKAADKAIEEGTNLICDAAESQLLSAIKDGNLTAIIFWLKNKHKDYKQPMFQSGMMLGRDEDDNILFEIFGKLKPETQRLVDDRLKLEGNKENKDEKR